MTELVFRNLPPEVAPQARILYEAPDPDVGPIDAPHIQLAKLGALHGDKIGQEGRLVATPRRLRDAPITIPFNPDNPASVAIAAHAAVQYLKVSQRSPDR